MTELNKVSVMPNGNKCFVKSHRQLIRQDDCFFLALLQILEQVNVQRACFTNSVGVMLIRNDGQ